MKTAKITTLLCIATAIMCLGVPTINLAWVCADGKTFIKEWKGNVGSIEGNIVVTDSSGNVWFNGPLPASHKIVLTNVPHGTWFMIEWKDWRGVHQERWLVECENNESYLCNDIPYPKSAQPTWLPLDRV